MKNKKKSFYFEDYVETELIQKNKSFFTTKVSLSRVTFIYFIFLSLILIFSLKIIYLSLTTEKNFEIYNTEQKNFLKERRDIIDSNGSVLATNVDLYNVGIRPKLLKDIEKKNLLIKLNLIFPDLDYSKIKNNLYKNDFFWIGKRLTPKIKEKYWLMGNKAFVFEQKHSRIYPQKHLFSHILGQTDDVNIGISGVEKFFEEDLKKLGYAK